MMGKEDGYGLLRMPSGEMRQVLEHCKATIGSVGNAEHQQIKLGKAGRKRHRGRRPQVRGSAMKSSSSGSSCGCGVGFELVFAVPLLIWLQGRRRRAREGRQTRSRE